MAGNGMVATEQAIVDALLALRVAESRLRKRVAERTGLSDNDQEALRLVVTAAEAGDGVGPKEIAGALAITTASTTVLLDRLEKKGLVRRAPSPVDRRPLLVRPTVEGTELWSSIDATMSGRSAVTDGVEPGEAAVITGFLNRMAEKVAQSEFPTT